MHLTTRARAVLQTMVDHEDEPEGELVHSTPGGWWLGDEQIPGIFPFMFLRNCLIRRTSDSNEQMERFVACEYTKRALTEPDFSVYDADGNLVEPKRARNANGQR